MAHTHREQMEKHCTSKQVRECHSRGRRLTGSPTKIRFEQILELEKRVKPNLRTMTIMKNERLRFSQW
jgi:hypothetical protein